MLQLATDALIVSGLLYAVSVVTFSWSQVTAKWVLCCAMVLAQMGFLMSFVFSDWSRALNVLAILFGFGSFQCGLKGGQNLNFRPARWVHRFVIYAGYGGTFAAMAAAALWLDQRAAAGWLAVEVFAGVCVLGTGCIFLAKTLTIRCVTTIMPDYIASLANNPTNQGC